MSDTSITVIYHTMSLTVLYQARKVNGHVFVLMASILYLFLHILY